MTKSEDLAAPQSVELSAAAFRTIAAMAHSIAGLQIVPSKASLVQSRLSRRLRALNFDSYEDYLNFLETSEGVREQPMFVSALTTNVTQFFREPHHFTTFENHDLPHLLNRARDGGRVRIWSAGCSSGQEAFSIASLIWKHEPRANAYDIRVLGTDIDKNVLCTASAAEYPSSAFAALEQSARLDLFVGAAGEDARKIRPEVSDLVRFKELNLMNPWPVKGPFDAIFCRNVVIYFSEDTQNQLWPRFVDVLAEGAPLFLGHSERINDPTQFSLQTDGLTTYRKAPSAIS